MTSLGMVGMRFGVGYAGATRTRVSSPCASGARPVKARPRVYNPVKTAWLVACMTSLAALALLFLNTQAMWANAAMAT